MLLSFKKWLEVFSMTGMGPPKESPVDPNPARGQTHAFPTFQMDSDPPRKKSDFLRKFGKEIKIVSVHKNELTGNSRKV